MRTQLSGAVIGRDDVFALAEFYAALLAWNVVDRYENGWALVKPPSGEQKLEFQTEEPFVPPVWPTVASEQQMGMHLDIAVEVHPPHASEDMRAAVEYAVSLGARIADHLPQGQRGITVMLDPAGRPFCLFPRMV